MSNGQNVDPGLQKEEEKEETIPYLHGVEQRTSPPVSKFLTSVLTLSTMRKNIALPEAVMAKRVFIGGVHFHVP